MRSFALALIAGLISTVDADAATWEFDIVARIDSAFLRDPVEDAAVVDGDLLKGRMSYSDPPSAQFGNDYVYAPGLETLSIATDAGFDLHLSAQVVSIASIGGTDFFVAQSFQSEDPNGWNMVFDIIATGWRGGDTSLPTYFPDSFDTAYISAYFLDEFDVIQSIEATILSVTPVPVSLPASGLLLAGALGLAFRQRRRQP